MIGYHFWVARRLSLAQREALRALAEGRPSAVGAPTMHALLRWQVVEAVEGAPKVTEFGAEVLSALPG